MKMNFVLSVELYVSGFFYAILQADYSFNVFFMPKVYTSIKILLGNFSFVALTYYCVRLSSIGFD